jgi:uncharacterized protein YndB with AHSA1/START domain
MPKIDVLDEAVIDSPPVAVFKAILDEYVGVTNWWMPIFESKPRGDKPIMREGSVFDIAIRTSKLGTPRFSEEVTKIEEAKLIIVAIAGDFVGTGEWTFEPTDGKTKVQYRFNVRTNRLLATLISPFVNIGKRHSDVMQIGFKALNSYLSKKY